VGMPASWITVRASVSRSAVPSPAPGPWG
jgi:hypothetical protein